MDRRTTLHTAPYAQYSMLYISPWMLLGAAHRLERLVQSLTAIAESSVAVAALQPMASCAPQLAPLLGSQLMRSAQSGIV